MALRLVVMNKEIIILAPFFGVIAAALVREIIDSKLRRILQERGLDPNPPELEMIIGEISPKRQWDLIKHNIAFRKHIDESLGTLSQATYIFHILMVIIFFALAIHIYLESPWK